MSQAQGTRDLIELAAEGRKARERRGKWERFWYRLCLMVVVRAILVPLDGWVLMLGVGFIHAAWLPGLPTIGYWNAVLLMFIIMTIWPPKIIDKADKS